MQNGEEDGAFDGKREVAIGEQSLRTALALRCRATGSNSSGGPMRMQPRRGTPASSTGERMIDPAVPGGRRSGRAGRGRHGVRRLPCVRDVDDAAGRGRAAGNGLDQVDVGIGADGRTTMALAFERWPICQHQKRVY